MGTQLENDGNSTTVNFRSGSREIPFLWEPTPTNEWGVVLSKYRNSNE